MKKQNLSVMDGSVSDEKKFCILHSTFCLSGFTLIEVLVALVVVAVTVSVVLGSQLQSLKIEQKARALQLFRFETQRIFSATHRAKNERQLIELLTTNRLCRIKSEKVQIESGTNVLIFLKHELNTGSLPSSSLRPDSLAELGQALRGRDYGGAGFSSVFYTRASEVPAPAAAGKLSGQANPEP